MPVGGSVVLCSFRASACGRAKIKTQSLTRRGIRRSPRPFFSSLGSLNVVCWIMLECCDEPKIALISVQLYVNDVCALSSPMVLSSCYFFVLRHCSEEGEILIDWRIIDTNDCITNAVKP